MQIVNADCLGLNTSLTGYKLFTQSGNFPVIILGIIKDFISRVIMREK